MSATKKTKRLDLQGIRGLAILSVLGFHFFPAQFPNGYLGVDQFFVLSGFLMCMLLKRAENEPTCTLITLFYSRRFKRILPLYLLIILLSMISLYALFPDTSIETNQDSALRALFFVSNAPKSEQDDYFTMLSKAVDIFTHTWSLSVEVQFYCLVPFIFLFAAKLSGFKLQCAYFALIGLFSYAIFYFIPENMSFNSVFARIWQFLIGMIVYILSSHSEKRAETVEDVEECSKLIEHEENSRDKPFTLHFISYLPMLSVIIINVFPYSLSTDFVRPLVTLGTGVLMMISENNLILSNIALTYIGDISYSIHWPIYAFHWPIYAHLCIHWPIYAYWKLNWDGDRTFLILALLFSILVAIIVYEFFEKWYLKLSSTNTGLLIVVLFLLNVIAINKDGLIPSRIENNNNKTKSTEDAIKMNHLWDLNDRKSLWVPYCDYEASRPLGWCNHTSLEPGPGKFKLAVIGNSWTANHGTLFHEECGSKAKIILQGSVGTCEPLFFSRCQYFFDKFQERIKAEKPDYLFIISRYISIGDAIPEIHTTTNFIFDKDPIYQTMKKQLLGLVASTKFKVYILDAVPRHDTYKTQFIADWAKEGADLVEINKRLGQTNAQLLDGPAYELARRRNSELVKDCGGRCVLVDYKPVFYNFTSQSYRMFDEMGYSYFSMAQHLTPLGLEQVRHVWKSVCEAL
ncbi:Acyl_transf_3 domain-containing protein [Caenorhabditis elegans]|uniref:Acyl_transf_3 domain-containing protein n=1 Tax=Caenorhabditis elegans TaxID=6239 RepID=O16531_CAEEL|nr:Acyl_transf_3 domain-containing protein [Caenorhabditis elegans]CCD64794.2 Acyl_transf_3 domain-containing protein [Caenorhabditis elegans]|eukprot:NP_001309481.1 O-ACyltransferase homolog [Caenorhabditis elegans]